VESILESSKAAVDESNSEEVPRCRFCWDTKAEPENPLFSTCKCSGSVGYIHFECLKSWLDVKKQMKTSPCFSSFYWKSFECEICKKAYPLVLRAKCETAKSGYRTYNLVNYERPEGSFLVLESLNQEKNTSRIIHIIRPNEGKLSFKFGRGHESDLRINDISVSRCHAIIKYKEDAING
jgi:RING-variant domain/FHA domain